jgi:hypothetical protein
MQEDSERLAPVLFPSDPRARCFPPEWRDVWFRRRSVKSTDGTSRYQCPGCGRSFDHTDIDTLQGDHIWPYSLFGETSWQNYRLICANCNAAKSNFVETRIRAMLGRGEFRQLIFEYLERHLDDGEFESGPPLEDIIGGRP